MARLPWTNRLRKYHLPSATPGTAAVQISPSPRFQPLIFLPPLSITFSPGWAAYVMANCSAPGVLGAEHQRFGQLIDALADYHAHVASQAGRDELPDRVPGSRQAGKRLFLRPRVRVVASR